MSTVLVALEEYLNTEYSPDREYVDGVVVERNVGERPHSFVQKNVTIYVQTRHPATFVWPEQRIRTVPGRRSRVPDVCVTLHDPKADVFDSPPFIVIEILSRRDKMSDLLEKLDEYAAFGVPHIWVLDPRRRKAFTYADGCLREAENALVADGIELPLVELFRGLD